MMGHSVCLLRIGGTAQDAQHLRQPVYEFFGGAWREYNPPGHSNVWWRKAFGLIAGFLRQARAKVRMSESMDDTKALSAEAVALGLIDPDAHAETVRIADAMARKFGAGVIVTDTQEQPVTANQSEQPETTGPYEYAGTSSDENPATDATKAETMAGFASVQIPHSQPTSSPDADKAGEPQDRNEPVSGSSATLTDDDVPAFLKRDHKPLRPHCLNPDLCAGGGSKHCYSCLKARDDATVAA